MNEELPEEEFEKRFDAGEDPKSLGFDLDNAVVEEPETKHIDIDFPSHVLEKLDHEAARQGVTRQSLIKMCNIKKARRGSLPFGGANFLPMSCDTDAPKIMTCRLFSCRPSSFGASPSDCDTKKRFIPSKMPPIKISGNYHTPNRYQSENLVNFRGYSVL